MEPKSTRINVVKVKLPSGKVKTFPGQDLSRNLKVGAIEGDMTSISRLLTFKLVFYVGCIMLKVI